MATLEEQRDLFLNSTEEFRKQLIHQENELSKIWSKFQQLQIQARFYFDLLIESQKGFKIHFPKDDVINNEDLLLSHSLEIITQFHVVDVDRIDFHKRADGIEFDCIIRCHKKDDLAKKPLIIAIEFKDFDIDKVIEQAHKRTSYVNMQYIVIGLSPKWLIYDRLEKVKSLYDHGIGLICFQYQIPIGLNMATETPVMILKSDVTRKPVDQAKLIKE